MAPSAEISPETIKVGKIDDVQELAKNSKPTIPERFIRDETERPLLTGPSRLTMPDGADVEIPIIDLSRIINESDEELSKLADACEQWGFFQVVNHDVDINLLEKMEELAMEFFMLPLAEKQKYPMVPGTVQGYGQAFIFSEDQKLDWCNMFALALEPKHSRNLKLWPDKPEKFRETIEKYSCEIRPLCKKILQVIARSLCLPDQNLFDEMFGEAVQAVRMNYYPRCPRPDLVLGLSPHSDGSAITVLQQEIKSAGGPSVAGLQILKDRQWVTVKPLPNALVINVGDTLEVLTNGKYKSVEHRAVTMEAEDRLSIVTFYAPSYDVHLGPLPELVGGGGARYRSYLHGEYAKHYVTNKLQGKKTIEFVKFSGDDAD